MCVCVCVRVCVCVCVCVCVSPLDIPHTGASTVDSGRDPVSSQKVSGELVSSVTCEECAVKCCAFSANHLDHLILFKNYVSRKAL